MIARLKFCKEGPIKFVGHLDLMRTFQKLFMRAGIPVAYSEGFNPHQIFSFATALAVGVSSEGEYIDLRLEEAMPMTELIAVINTHAPRGIKVVEGVELLPKEPKAMAVIVAARYTVTMNGTLITQEMIDAVKAMASVTVKKKSKKGKINDLDIRPGILELDLKDKVLSMLISTGSQFNVKPEMLLEKICALNELTFVRGDFNIHRVELYQENEGLKTLLEPKLKGSM